MTQDEIIRMAIECQLVTTNNRDGVYMQALERFAALVAEATKAQPQGERVDLTDDEVWDAVDDPDLSDGSSGYVEWWIPGVAEAVIAKFKSKNTPTTASLAAIQMRDAAVKICREAEVTGANESESFGHAVGVMQCAELISRLPLPEAQPPVVPQGEPVAWGEVVLREGEVTVSGYLYGQLPIGTKLYTTPPSVEAAIAEAYDKGCADGMDITKAQVEAAIESTKEKAAHIVVGWTSCGPITETDRVLEKIIAAIRSMK